MEFKGVPGIQILPLSSSRDIVCIEVFCGDKNILSPMEVVGGDENTSSRNSGGTGARKITYSELEEEVAKL